jgi:hypothetical protein
MPSWNEIKDYARSKYTLNNDEDDFLAILFGFDDDRSQLITVRNFQDNDEEWVEFRTFICAEADLKPRVALRKNEEFLVGALALDKDGYYCLIHNARLATLDLVEFEHPLQLLALCADQLELDHAGTDEY